MTTPIKPPGQSPGLPPSEATEPVEGFDGPRGQLPPSEGVSEAGRAGSVGAPATGDAAARVAAALRAGQLDPAAAVDQLLERVLAQGPATQLSATQRTALESLLREALGSDPTLAAMLEDLERG